MDLFYFVKSGCFIEQETLYDLISAKQKKSVYIRPTRVIRVQYQFTPTMA
jgi:hypothetical protein